MKPIDTEITEKHYVNGQQLRAARWKSLRETAKDLGISPTYLSKIENSERAKISKELAERLWEYLEGKP